MTSQYFDDFMDVYMCGCENLMTSQSGRGLVLICMERGSGEQWDSVDFRVFEKSLEG